METKTKEKELIKREMAIGALLDQEEIQERIKNREYNGKVIKIDKYSSTEKSVYVFEYRRQKEDDPFDMNGANFPKDLEKFMKNNPTLVFSSFSELDNASSRYRCYSFEVIFKNIPT
ncbi:hypothetical protein FACS189428_6230 [Clostridia bacterium]|nr:hypothetical protein FACS189428_6230 [Clostridia bacterium]